MLGITRKEFINYSLFPGIVPRLKELFVSGFQHIPFFMALVYQSVRLLPSGHAYTNPANLGKFGVRHVIGEAANNLVFSKNNIDQIIVFACLLVGMVIVFIEILLLFISFLAGSAMAAMPTGFSGFFTTANPQQDLAFMMFDLIFGIPGTGKNALFGSCFSVSGGAGCRDTNGQLITDGLGNPLLGTMGWPLPIHEGLHSMFYIYNLGLMVVAAMIVTYFIITVLMETAQTGTPFGKRFNKVWAPVRLVVAIGLLIPFSPQTGLNSAQYIVLYAAKYGSGFASNGWRIFNQTLTGAYTGQINDLVSQPSMPNLSGLHQFLFTAATCSYLEDNSKPRREIKAYLVRDGISTPSSMEITAATYYKDAVKFANGSRQLAIRFGVEDKKEFATERGKVSPICGELVIPLTDPRIPGNTPGPTAPDPAAAAMQAFYYNMFYELWFVTFGDAMESSGRPMQPEVAGVTPSLPDGNYTYNFMLTHTDWGQKPPNNKPIKMPGPTYRDYIQRSYEADMKAMLEDPSSRQLPGMDPSIGKKGVLELAKTSNKWEVDNAMLAKGWAAAGIWYNKIAELNGMISTTVLNIPVPTRWPAVMEYVRKKKQQDQNASVGDLFEPVASNNQQINFPTPNDELKAITLWHAYNFWQQGGGSATPRKAPTGNMILDFINSMFGTSGLYSIRENPTTHPLAQLVGVGRSLVDAATRNLQFALGATAVGMIGMSPSVSGGSAVVISLMMTIVTIALTIGFILYYVLPFLPFIYFFFAVGGWFKAIFEAMVGAPLWALAHIRIDGPGLPGQAAVNGYFLIFEIFLRPILIVFGLLASISIFSALVYVLNSVWDLVTANLSGFDVNAEQKGGFDAMINYMRGPIDEFFFTVIYAVVVYIMALSTFKLIDRIPGTILRWMGQSVKVFTEESDPGQELSATAAVGGNQVLDKVGTSATKAMTGIATGNTGKNM